MDHSPGTAVTALAPPPGGFPEHILEQATALLRNTSIEDGSAGEHSTLPTVEADAPRVPPAAAAGSSASAPSNNSLPQPTAQEYLTQLRAKLKLVAPMSAQDLAHAAPDGEINPSRGTSDLSELLAGYFDTVGPRPDPESTHGREAGPVVRQEVLVDESEVPDPGECLIAEDNLEHGATADRHPVEKTVAHYDPRFDPVRLC